MKHCKLKEIEIHLLISDTVANVMSLSPILTDIHDDVCGLESCDMNNVNNEPASAVSPYNVSKIVQTSADTWCDTDKVQFLKNCWRPNGAHCELYTYRFGNNIQVKFQLKWLDQRQWLAYSAHKEGGA